MVDPLKDTRWKTLKQHIETDGVHYEDRIQPHGTSQGLFRHFFSSECMLEWAERHFAVLSCIN